MEKHAVPVPTINLSPRSSVEKSSELKDDFYEELDSPVQSILSLTPVSSKSVEDKQFSFRTSNAKESSGEEAGDSEVTEQLMFLQQEMKKINEKLVLNEQHISDKKKENRELQELVASLNYKIIAKEGERVKKRGRCGCCNEAKCNLM